MTEQFAALASLVQNPGKTRDDVLADFYDKWQNDYLVNLYLYDYFEDKYWYFAVRIWHSLIFLADFVVVFVFWPSFIHSLTNIVDKI